MTPKHRKGDLGVKLQNISWGSPSPDPTRNLRLRRLFRESVSICPRTAPNWLLHVLCVTFSAYLTSSTCLFLLRGLLKVWKYPLPEHVEMDPLVGTFLKLPSNEPVNVLARVYVIKVHNQILAVSPTG